MRSLLHRLIRSPAPVPVRRFDGRRWVRCGGIGAAAAQDRLSLATYNIWFNSKHASQRYRAIADVLAKDCPDVVVFQEVTETAREVFLAQPWIREQYLTAAVTGSGVGNYGMLVASRLPLGRVTYTRLPTRLSRGYLTAQFSIAGRPLTVVGLHLESGKAAAQLRERQLGRIVDAVRDDEDVVIMGDFNLRDAENGILPTDYRDVWPALRPGEPGYTEDTTINHMRFDMKDKHRHVRFDRMLVKGPDWSPESVHLLGREPIAPELPRVFPSDHFGVWCTLVRAG